MISLRLNREGTYISLWLILADLWQKPYNIVIILQLKIKKEKKRKKISLNLSSCQRHTLGCQILEVPHSAPLQHLLGHSAALGTGSAAMEEENQENLRLSSRSLNARDAGKRQ